ncbi:MAG: PorT family protein [Muribaculaceae bacterium]|nr:PorT family protein [Muribaculaceae bacterium]
MRYTVNLILSLLLSVIAVQSVMAQRYYRPTWDIGAKGGMTMSNIQFSPGVEQSMLQGVEFGVMARYSEEKLFGLMAELKVTQRGWKELFRDTDFKYQRRLTYVELPVMTHINFGSRVFRGFVNLGPSVSYMLSSGITSNFDYHDPASVQGFLASNRHLNQMTYEVKNKIDYGIVGGAGIELRIGKRNSVMLEGRYYFGLGNIFPAAKKDEFSASRVTSVEISLGYMFRLKN